jgi:hypothetical protein
LLVVQAGVPFSVLQTAPHFPQFKTSFVSERQNPLQQVPPVPHGPLPLQASTQLPLGLHFLFAPPAVQSALVVQATQRWLDVSHCSPDWQSVAVLQPAAH